jgi:hypothetical protein
MGTFSQERLKRGLRNPRLFARYVNRLYHTRLNTRSYNTDGIDVMSEEWDNLLLLDACRCDMFQEQHSLEGQLESRVSRGSATVEFLRGNVDCVDLRNTVYVTANPKLVEHQDDIDASFHEVINVWTEEWDEDRRTVLPEVVTEYAIDAATTHPNKRLFVHYIQPHYPFLTDGPNPFDNSQAFEDPDKPGSWQQIMSGEVNTSREAVWQAYSETLDRALPAVEDFLDEVSGLSVVTADHGNMVGERSWPIPIREWGHPEGIYTEELVKVPWFISSTGERRTVTKGSEAASDDIINADLVEERLENLGYKT